jgi:hypothetical protein
MTAKGKAEALLWSLVSVAILGMIGGGWYARDVLASLATKEDVLVAFGKSDFLLDRQIEATAAQIAYLERKPNLTATELNQLNYLRDQLRRLRQVRDGK